LLSSLLSTYLSAYPCAPICHREPCVADSVALEGLLADRPFLNDLI
jgi:hypothetical protein